MCSAKPHIVLRLINRVCPNEFCRIANYKRAKEAWDILLVTREGTSVVKISKLQMFATKFENIMIHEIKTILSFILN